MIVCRVENANCKRADVYEAHPYIGGNNADDWCVRKCQWRILASSALNSFDVSFWWQSEMSGEFYPPIHPSSFPSPSFVFVFVSFAIWRRGILKSRRSKTTGGTNIITITLPSGACALIASASFLFTRLFRIIVPYFSFIFFSSSLLLSHIDILIVRLLLLRLWLGSTSTSF